MKFAGKIVLSAGIVCFLLMTSGCKKSTTEPEPVSDQQIDLLTKSPWLASAVTLDGVAQTGYTSFTLTMTGTKGTMTLNFTTSGRPALSAWPPSGNFTIDATNPATTLTRNDTPPVVVTYAATGTDLTMSFTFSGNGYTRVDNVKGVWNFTFHH